MTNLEDIVGKHIVSIGWLHDVSINRMAEARYSPCSIVLLEFDDGSALEMRSCIEGKGGQRSAIEFSSISSERMQRDKSAIAKSKDSGCKSEFLRADALRRLEKARSENDATDR